MSNIVAIVGRPNVGKSTLFNRLTETRQAIVHEEEGVTRDRHYGKCIWGPEEFSVIDTGGYIENSTDVFEQEISRQVLLAIDEADVILFMVDVVAGITEYDLVVSDLLRKVNKRVVVIANKVDNYSNYLEAYDIYSLGFPDVFFVSSVSGSGTGDMLDHVISLFTKSKSVELDPFTAKFTVVGRPNVGKSSFLNTLLGEDRNIVTPVAGTTRDTINTHYTKYNKNFFLIDTAGLRKKNKQMENIEFYSVMRSIRAIEQSDVCFLIIDAQRGIGVQDLNIFHLIHKNHKGVVILVNKWDLIEKDNKTHLEYEQAIKTKLAPFNDVPIIFVSALTKQRVFKALDVAETVFKNRSRRLKTSELNEFLLDIVKETPPPAVKGKYVKIKYITQLKTRYPAFVFFANLPQYVKDPYKRFVENKIRGQYDFTGVPIEIYFRKK